MRKIRPRYYAIIILLTIILMCLFSCVATRKQRERFLKENCVLNSIVKDSIRVEIKEVEKTVTIHDTIQIKSYLPNPCSEMCDSLGNVKKGFSKSVKNNKGTNTTLYEKDGGIEAKTEIEGIKTKATFIDTTINRFRSEIQQVRDNCKLEHLTKWDSFWIRLGQILSGLIGIVAIGFGFKKWFS